MKKQTTVSTQFNLAQAQKSTKEIEEILDKSYKYKDHLQEMKKYFDLQFNKAKLEKVLMNLDNKDSSKEGNSNLIFIRK